TGAVVLAVAFALAAALALVIRRRGTAAVGRPGGLELVCALVAGVAVVGALYTGPWLGQSADTFYHTAAASALLREHRALPQDVFFNVVSAYPDVSSGSLNLVLAWVANFAGVVPAWFALTIFGAAFSTACWMVFAREITGSTAAASIGGVLYLVIGLDIDMRAAGYPNRIAPGLVWLVFTFVIRFTRDSRDVRELLCACALAIAAVSVYSGTGPLIVVIAGAALTASAAVALARRRRIGSILPLAIACAAVVAVILPLVIVRVLSAVVPPGPEASLATLAARLPVVSVGGYEFVDFRVWFTGLVSVSTVGTLCLLGRARKNLLDGEAGAALLWGCLILLPAVALTPLLAQSPSTVYLLLRIALLLMPMLFVPLAWELAELDWIRDRIWRRSRAAIPTLRLITGYGLVTALALILVDQLPQGLIARYAGHASYSMSTSRANNLTVQWADRLRAIDAAGPGAILAGLETSYELAGLTGRRVVAVPAGHTPYQDEARDGALRRGDVADALRPDADPSALLSILVRYDVRFVISDRARDGDASFNWIASQHALARLAGGRDWSLYRFDTGNLDQALQIPTRNGFGIFPTRVIAGRAVFVRVPSEGPAGRVEISLRGLASGMTFRVRVDAAGAASETATVPILIPDSARVDRYAITVTQPGGRSIEAGEVDVGKSYEAEFFAGVVRDTSRGFARPGWEAVDGPEYNRGEAALALRDTMESSHPLSEAQGQYCLAVSVYDDGDDATHTLNIALGGEVVTATWSGAKGRHDVDRQVSLGGGHELTYWVPATATAPRTIVDTITLFPTASGGDCAP
ncbi:MAG TPA: hypothetical protein VI172_06275, partial [Candidatus Dormibacteraeota bacterium]